MIHMGYAKIKRIEQAVNARDLERAKARYGDNHWWESNDPRIKAYYQVHEPTLILPNLGDFRKCLEVLLGREVYPQEFLGQQRLIKLVDEKCKEIGLQSAKR